MTAQLRIFYRLIVRPLHREPMRTLLTVVAVALGVAVVLAIELAGDAATGSFHASIETLTGKADLEVTAVGGVPDAVVGRLAALPYPIKVQPRIDDFATLHNGGTNRPADRARPHRRPSGRFHIRRNWYGHRRPRANAEWQSCVGKLSSGSEGRRHHSAADQR